MAVIDGYLGPSRRQPSGSSRASVARWQIQRWTEARGWRVGRILEEASPQASAAPRRLRELAVERVECYETDGLVTTSLRELGDSLTEVIYTIERIDAAGGAFASLHEGFDLSTAPGRYTFRLLLFVVEWEQRGER
jgi:DNA invertase Pin-like site-specific DNA recombinase